MNVDIGKIEKEFDFLGYHLRPDGLRVAQATLENFIARATRLYEQEREAPDGVSRLGLYVKRWRRWVLAGVDVSASSSVLGLTASVGC